MCVCLFIRYKCTVNIFLFEQRVKIDGLDDDIREPQKVQETQLIIPTESPPRKPKRNGSSMKVIPASHAKIELERKPHPPETSSPNKLKPPETQNILQY